MPKVSTVGDFIQEQHTAKIIDYTNPGCVDCNECCSMGAMLTDEEYSLLRKFFKTSEGKQIYIAAVNRIKKAAKQGHILWICPLSNHYNRCTIYRMRPKICRDFHCTSRLQSPDYEDYLSTMQGKKGRMIYDLFKKFISVEPVMRDY